MMEGRVAMMGAAFVAYLAVMTVFDFAKNSVMEGGNTPEKTDPIPKMSAFSAPSVKVLYCIS